MTGNTGLLTQRCDPFGAENERPQILGGVMGDNMIGKIMWRCENPAAGRYRTDIVKPFCPCDTGRPQDCKPEEWPGAHDEPPCLGCGGKRYRHFGAHLFCKRPAAWPGEPDREP